MSDAGRRRTRGKPSQGMSPPLTSSRPEVDIRRSAVKVVEAPFAEATNAPATVLVETPQRNRNELGETTVNKTWRKHLPQQ